MTDAPRRDTHATPTPAMGRAAESAQLRPYRFAIFAAAGVRHGITRRTPGQHRDGDISYATGGDAAAVYASRRAWAASIGLDAAAIVAAQQIHGAAVASVSVADRGRGARGTDEAIPAVDALLTDAPDTPLLMGFADCAPLLFHDACRGVVGLAHAGWRGTVADVAGETVRALVARYGSDPGDLLVGIGPAIGPCCYVVGREVIDAWHTLGVAGDSVVRPADAPGGRGQWTFDLPGANRLLLGRAGVRADQIEDAALCTACQVATFFSHRAERGQTGRFAALIGLTTKGE